MANGIKKRVRKTRPGRKPRTELEKEVFQPEHRVNRYRNKSLWEAAKPPTGVARHRKYPTAESLFKACIKYFRWAEANPFYEERIVSDKGSPVREHIAKPRVFTMYGIQTFIGLNAHQWTRYRKEIGGDYEVVIDVIEACIKDQKFTLTASGFLNSSLMIRDLGYADKMELTGEGGTPLNPPVGPVVILPEKDVHND